MLFNSLDGLQASKYIFIPDGVNSFQIQSEVDAMSMRQVFLSACRFFFVNLYANLIYQYLVVS